MASTANVKAMNEMKPNEETPTASITTALKQLTDCVPNTVKNSHIAKDGIGDPALFSANIEYINNLKEKVQELQGKLDMSKQQAILYKENLRASLNKSRKLRDEMKDISAMIRAAKKALNGN